MKDLAIRLAVFAALLGSLDRAASWYARRSFLDEIKFNAAVRTGDGLVFVGDSCAYAALDFAVLADRLRDRGVDVVPVDLTLNSTDTRWHALAGRALVRARPKTRGVVIAFAMNRMLERTEPVDPALWNGFDGSLFSFITPEDLPTLFRGGVLGRPDLALSYFLGHDTALYRYRTILRYRTDARRDRLVNGPRPADQFNEFGNKADFIERLAERRRVALENLEKYRSGDTWRMNPWFDKLREELRRKGIPLYLVELPVVEQDRLEVAESPQALAFREARRGAGPRRRPLLRHEPHPRISRRRLQRHGAHGQGRRVALLEGLRRCARLVSRPEVAATIGPRSSEFARIRRRLEPEADRPCLAVETALTPQRARDRIFSSGHCSSIGRAPLS